MAIKKIVGNIDASQVNNYCSVCPVTTRRITYGKCKNIKSTSKDLLKKRKRLKTCNGTTPYDDACSAGFSCPLQSGDIQNVYVVKNDRGLPPGCECTQN